MGRGSRSRYVPYDLLHRTWQEHVVQMVETRLAGHPQAQTLVTELRRRYRRGFVAHVQGNVLPRMTQLTQYLVKYVVSPPMALSRILAYDRERASVTYWYRDHLSHGKRTVETVDRSTFIGRMVQHILPKGWRAPPLLWPAGHVHPDEDAAEGDGRAARSGAAGPLRAGRAPHTAALSGAHAGDPGLRPAGVPTLRHGTLAVADLASSLWHPVR